MEATHWVRLCLARRPPPDGTCPCGDMREPSAGPRVGYTSLWGSLLSLAVCQHKAVGLDNSQSSSSHWGGAPEMGARVRMSHSRYGCAGLSSSHRSDLSYAKGSDSLQGLSVRCGAERSISSPVLWLAGPSDPRRPMGFARLCPNCSATSASRAQVGTGLASDSATAASVVMSHHTALHVRLEEEAHLVVLTG